jgi:DNA-directed RNA polymerase subunit RPC12/RpoP
MPKTYVRCKVCGFVMEEKNLGEVCPACGFKRTVFVPDTDRLSPMRRTVLDMHIHPIIVHFPQAFVFLLLVLSNIALFSRDPLHDNMVLLVRYLTILLPFFVAGAFISGMIDAKVRLKKLITPILYSKIVAGSIFFVSSLASAYLAVVLKEFHHALFFVMDGLFILAFVCSVVVGKLGTLLICTKVQG